MKRKAETIDEERQSKKAIHASNLIGNMDHSIDLIDDVWQRIFFSFGQERARFMQVSKRWRNVILNSWRIFDGYDITTKGGFGDREERRRSSALLQFIKLRLTNLVDVSIELHTEEDIDDVLNTFLQIKSLKHLRLNYIHLEKHQANSTPHEGHHWCKSLLTPRCNDLVLLNLSNSQFLLRTEALASLVAGVPNLEELYLANQYDGDLTPIYQLKKLQRIYISGARNAEELAKNMPHLKYVIFKGESSSFSFSSQAKTCRSTEIGTTLIIEDNYMTTNNIELIRKVKDLITPQHAVWLSKLAAEGNIGDYFTFLVKEMKLDINYEPGTIPEYRLVSVDSWESWQTAITGLVARISHIHRKRDTLESGTESQHFRFLKHFLELGADPNTIVFPKQSGIVPLVAIPNPEVIIMLIEHGMDIQKVVPIESERDLPSYFYVMKNIVPDSPELLTEIIKRVDINKELDDGYTFLQHAITYQRKYAINMLHKAGVKWTPAALESLIDRAPDMFDRFVVKKSFDFKLLNPCAIFRALERGLLPELKVIVAALPDERDSFGLTPMHHAALIHAFESPSPQDPYDDEKQAPSNFQRWVDNEAGFRISTAWGDLRKQTGERDATRFITPSPTLPDPDDDKMTFGGGSLFGTTTSGFSFGGGNTVTGGGLFGKSTLSAIKPLDSLNMNDDIGYIGVTNHTGGGSTLFGSTGSGFSFGGSTKRTDDDEGTNTTGGGSTLFGSTSRSWSNSADDLPPITSSSISSKPRFTSMDDIANASGFSFGANSTGTDEGTGTNTTGSEFSFGGSTKRTDEGTNSTAGGSFSFGGNTNNNNNDDDGPNNNNNSTGGGFSFGGNTSTTGGFGGSVSREESSGFNGNSTDTADIGPGVTTWINPLKMDDERLLVKRRQECDIADVLPLLKHCNINAQNSYGETPLLMLIKSNVNIMTNFHELLQHGADPKIPDNNGWTPLHAALYLGSWSVATELIAHGADVNAQDRLGITPLMALLMGYVHNHEQPFDDFENEWFKLLTTGVNYKLVDKTFNRSLMHYIACIGSLNMANSIVSEHRDIVNARDIEGWTPLHYAILHCNYNMVSFLLQNGADPNAQTTVHKVTPAMLCTHLKQAKYFFSASGLTNQLIAQHLFMLATPIITREDSKSAMMNKYRYIEPPWTQSPRERVSQNTSNTVWKSEYRDILRMIVPVSDPHLKDINNSTLLHHLVHIATNTDDRVYYIMDIIRAQKEFMPYWSVSDDLDVVPSKQILGQVTNDMGVEQKLADATVTLFKEHQIQIYNDVDDLHIVAKVLEKVNLKELLPLIDFTKVPAQVCFTPPEQRRSLLDHLIIGPAASPELFERVLALHPQSLNTQNTQGNTPLLVAVEKLLLFSNSFVKQSIELVDFFLSRKDIDLNKQNNKGDTALHMAASMFNLAAIDALNNNLTATFWFGLPYCIAAFRLIEAKARLDIKNKAGKTPLDYCPRLIDHFHQYNELIKRKLEEQSKEVAKYHPFLEPKNISKKNSRIII